MMPSPRHRSSLLLQAIFALLLSLGPASAQTFPYHADPSQREAMGERVSVPAIRFLTTPDFPPFNYRGGDGALVGFNVDLARALCDELEAVCTIQAWPWDQVTDALSENQGDALIGGLAITPQSAQDFDFTASYLAFPARFVTGKAKAAAFDPLKAGLRIAVRRGSAHEKFLQNYLPGAAIAPSDTELTALDAVKAGEADAYFGDAMRASFWLNANTECCAFAGDPYFRNDLFGEGLAIAVPAGHDGMRTALDHGLIRLKRDGKMDELYLRWFPIGFY